MRRLNQSRLFLGVCALFAVTVAQAAPVPVTNIVCNPGFVSSQASTVRQDLLYVAVGTNGYAVAGATCTWCVGSVRASTSTNTIPATSTNALTGLVYTDCVLDMGSAARFALGVTVTNDSIGIVLGEVGTTAQTTGDPVNVYPTTNGVRVGSWVRAIVSADYGRMNAYPWHVYRSDGNQQDLQGFLTTLRLSDFTNDTGMLSFDGIELAGNNNFDPNIVATMGGPLPLYVRSTTNVCPVTGLAFSPGFDENPELDGQTLAGITTSEGTFNSITGLACVAQTGTDWVDATPNESMPAHATNALSGLKFTQMAANPETVDWALGMTISQTNTNLRFFFGETSPLSTPDVVTIIPLSGGVPVGSWKLDVAVSDYGPASPRWKSVKLPSTPFAAFLVSFAITDFTSSSALPLLVGVDGFRVDCKNTADPNLFGMYTLPPPLPRGTLIRIQ